MESTPSDLGFQNDAMYIHLYAHQFAYQTNQTAHNHLVTIYLVVLYRLNNNFCTSKSAIFLPLINNIFTAGI